MKKEKLREKTERKGHCGIYDCFMTTFSKSLAKGMLLAAAAAAAALYHIHLYHFIRLRAPSHEGTIHVYMLLYYMNASRIERCISVRYINRNLLFVQFFFFWREPLAASWQ